VVRPDPAALRDLAERLRGVALTLRAVVAAPAAVEAWGGVAAAAYAEAVGTLRRRAEGMADVLDELATALVGGPDPEQALVEARLLIAVETDLAASSGSRALDTARATRDALDRIAATPDPVTGRPVEAHLLAYEPHAFGGDGRVVVAAGDPSTADDVAVVVPGLGTDGGAADTQARRALRLHLAARTADPVDGNAVVAWIGYDAPEGLGVLSERMAAAGGALLCDAVDDLRADRDGDPAHVTVVGHSYGATTVALAATGPGGLAADDVVLAGSPGAGDAGTVRDLGLAPGHVWVLRNSRDPVAALGAAGPVGLGPDPALDTWGATRLRAESQAEGDAWPATDHASYFAPHGEGLGNLAHVVSGQLDGVTTAPPVRDPWWAPPLDPELGRTPAGAAPRAVR
jgi:uncharacterized protein YukE